MNKDNINKITLIATKISNGDISNALEFAQSNDELYKLLVDLDLPHDEQQNKYGSILNLQDDLDYAGIPIAKSVRDLWDENALMRKQARLEEIVNSYRDSVIEECSSLIKEFAK